MTQVEISKHTESKLIEIRLAWGMDAPDDGLIHPQFLSQMPLDMMIAVLVEGERARIHKILKERGGAGL